MATSKGQSKGRRTDHLAPWQFKPGQSGNPGGMPKGTISLKTYAKRYLQELTDEEKMEFLAGLDKDIVWKMAEGNPDSKGEIQHSLTLAFDPNFKEDASS